MNKDGTVLWPFSGSTPDSHIYVLRATSTKIPCRYAHIWKIHSPHALGQFTGAISNHRFAQRNNRGGRGPPPIYNCKATLLCTASFNNCKAVMGSCLLCLVFLESTVKYETPHELSSREFKINDANPPNGHPPIEIDGKRCFLKSHQDIIHTMKKHLMA